MGVVGGRSKREGIHVRLHACFRSSHVWLSMTLWTVAHQGSIHGILHARILEWVAVPSSRGSSQPRDWNHVSYVSCVGRGVFTTSTTCETQMYVWSESEKLLSCVRLFVTPWTRLLHPWNFLGKSTGVGCHFLLQGIFLTRGSNLSPTLQADALPSEPPGIANSLCYTAETNKILVK